MTRFSTLYVVRKLQIKTMKYYYTHLLEELTSNTLTPNVVENVELQEFLFIIGGSAEWYSHFGRQFDSFLQSMS